MDQTNDFCINTFTAGQCNRARAAFFPSPNTFTRAEFIENYFSISKIGPAGCGETTIRLQNPMCLPVSWNISGNGAITPTSVANVYVLSGSGTVIVEARGANSYTDRKTFTFSPPDNISISFTNSGASATVTATASGLVASYTWQTTNGVTIDGQSSPVTTSSPTVTLRAPNCTITNTQLTIRANTSCGVSDAVTNNVPLNNSPSVPDIPTITFSVFNCTQRTALATTINADYYVWETPNGFLINGLPSPQTTISNSITLTLPSGVSGIKGYVRVKGANCKGESVFSTMTDVTIGAAPPIFTATVLDPYMGRYKGYVQAMQGASSYEWYQDQLNTPNPNFTGTFFQGNIPEGECGVRHTLSVRSIGSCGYSSFSNHEDIVLCEEFFISSPNPANETLNVATISPNSNGGNRPKIFQMKIFDQSGNLKKHWTFPAGVYSTSQPINFLAPGVYWLSANNGNAWKAKIFFKN